MRSPLAFLKGSAEDRENQGARLFLMSSYLLLIIACYTTTKAVRDSLFIINIGPSQLPYLYVLIAGIMGLISATYPRVLRRIGLYSLVRLTSLIAVASFLLFWWLVEYESPAWFYLLYVWVSLFGAITASQAWSLANHVFDAREARRSFAWIGLGGVLGGIVGGSLARIVAPWKGTELLLPICAVLMAATVIILHGLGGKEDWKVPSGVLTESERPKSTAMAVFNQIRASSYLSLMVAFLFTGVIVEAFVDYEYKVIAHQSFDSKDRLTSFFGTIASYGGMLALVVQMLMTNRFLKRFGVGAAILLLPSAMLTGFLVVAAWPALWAVSLLKLIDGCLSYSLHRSGMELLYVPIATKLRASVKAFIDLLVDRAGRAVGGVLLLLLTTGLSLSITSLSVAAAICLAVWLVLAFMIRKDYVNAFRAVLEKRVIEPEALDIRTLDHTIADTLLQALSSPDDRQVLYALDLLGSTYHTRWHKQLPALVAHRSSEVRKRTIGILTDWNLHSPALVVDRLSDPDLRVRIEAVRHLCVLDPGSTNTKLKEFVTHTDYRVVLAAIHCIAKYRLGEAELIDQELIERALSTTGEHRVSARTAAARALAIATFPDAVLFLDALLLDSSPDVVQQAIRTAGEVRHARAIPTLIALLGRSRLRRDAREALLKIGSPALAPLCECLQDEQAPLEIRARIPKALSLFSNQEIACFLLGRVHRSTPRLDTPLLKALTRMRTNNSDTTYEANRVSALILEESERHLQLSRIRHAIEPRDTETDGETAGPVHSLMLKALDERRAEITERVLFLLALIYPPEDIHAVFFNLKTRHGLKASAVEFLENILDPQLRSLVMPLVENRNGPRSAETEEGSEMLHQEAIQILLADDDEWLRTIAGQLSSRLPWTTQVSQLEKL